MFSFLLRGIQNRDIDTKDGILTEPLFRTSKDQKSRGNSVESPSLDDIPYLIETILNSNGKKTTVEIAAAVKHLYYLSDVFHKQNRVPMVCSGRYDVLTPLAQCLTQESGNARQLACLALNNLSVPKENKSVIALGPSSKDVIGGLCKVIAEDKIDSYLCCLVLFNLSFLEATVTTISQHSPSADGKAIPPLENPSSFLRVIEKVLADSHTAPKASSWFIDFLKPRSGTAAKDAVVRWACGLIRNLANSEEAAALIGQTEIPKCVVENIRSATAPPSQWKRNSLEDASLFAVLNLSEWPRSREVLVNAGAVDAIKSIMAEDNYHGLRATMACAFLDETRSAFPDGGKPAAKAVSELIKDGRHDHCVLELRTATKAYALLAKAPGLPYSSGSAQPSVENAHGLNT